jgi:hypothetical protein
MFVTRQFVVEQAAFCIQTATQKEHKRKLVWAMGLQ